MFWEYRSEIQIRLIVELLLLPYEFITSALATPELWNESRQDKESDHEELSKELLDIESARLVPILS